MRVTIIIIIIIIIIINCIYIAPIQNISFYGTLHCISVIGSGQPAVSNKILRGSHLLPSQLPGEHIGVLPHMVHSPCEATHHHHLPQPCLGRVRSPMVGHESDGPQVVFNVNQSHRHDSTHPSLFTKLGTTCIYVECSTAGPCHVSHYGAMLAGWSPIHVLTRLMIA